MLKNEKTKKYIEDILIFLAFWIIIFTIIVSKEINSLDEVWVFNTARNIANGLMPYKDFNLVTTPGLPIICGLILKLFGTEMFFMRLMASILNSCIFFIIYKILKALGINKYISLMFVGLVLNLYKVFLYIDYNVIVLFIALFSLLIELKKYNLEKEILKLNIKTDFLLGLLIGTTILMKQTTGVFIIITFIGYKFLFIENMDELKKFFKIAMVRMLAICVPIIIFIIYLIYNNIMSDFINYAILGIKEFTNKSPYMKLVNSKYFLLAVLAPITFLILLITSFEKKDKISLIIFAYAISTFIVVFPISDPPHFLLAATIDMIGLIYIINMEYKDKIEKYISKKIKIYITEFSKNTFYVFLILLVITSCVKLSKLKLLQYNKLKNFKYIPVSTDLLNEINTVDNYILNSNKDVYILEARAPLYMIPINKYNKDYDMFLIGNLGLNATNRILKDLDSKNNTEILLFKGNLNWQTPVDIVKYIQENYNKVGEIGNFDIYSKQKIMQTTL